MLKFLIVGFGSIGKRHFDNLREIGGVEVAVLTRRHIDIPGITLFNSLEEALRQEYDAVFITNETSSHIPAALAFAERRCHLFIEKPLSHDLKNTDRLLELATRHNLKVMVGCNLRFHPAVNLGRDFIRKGTIGRVVSAQIQAGQYLPDWHPGRDYRQSYSARKDTGGGVILDLIHELDYAYWFFGAAGRVFAFSGKRGELEIETEDTAEILLEFQNGVWCQVHLDYLRRRPARAFTLIGTGGIVEGDIINNNVRVYEASRQNWEAGATGGAYDNNAMYLTELRHFIDYINGAVPQPLIGLEDGINVLKIALAARESARTGKVVRLQTRRSNPG
jgi:predicted dehydrogenase